VYIELCRYLGSVDECGINKYIINIMITEIFICTGKIRQVANELYRMNFSRQVMTQ
jgi:hypothetical protein